MIPKSQLISLSEVPGMGPRRIRALNALNQNREVFALPGQTDSAKSIGTNRLIQQGARLVTNVDDLLSEFQLQSPPKQVELLPKIN